MLNYLKESKDNYEDGFTLTELIVVIVIIGILAAIAVPMYINNRHQATDVALKADVKNAANLLEATMTDGEKTPRVVPLSTSDTNSLITITLPPQGGFCLKGIATTGTTYNFDSNGGGFREDGGCNIETVESTEALPLNGTTAKYCWGSLLGGLGYAFDQGNHAYDKHAKVHRKEMAFADDEEYRNSPSYIRKWERWNEDIKKCSDFYSYTMNPANKDSELTVYVNQVLEPAIVKGQSESTDDRFLRGFELQQLEDTSPRKVFTTQEVNDYLYVYDYMLDLVQKAPNYTGPTVPFIH